MTILVIAEHTNAALAPATLNTVAAAQRSVAIFTFWSPVPTLAPLPKPLPRSLA